MNLSQALAKVSEGLSALRGRPLVNQGPDLGDEVDASGALSGAPRVGESFPDFILPDAQGQVVSSASLRAQGPVVVLMQRGVWCPYCDATLLHYNRALPEFQKWHASVVSISPSLEPLHEVQKRKLMVDVPLLSDEGMAYAKQLGLVYELEPRLLAFCKAFNLPLAESTGGVDDRLPASATFVVSAEGRVLGAWASANYLRRPDVAEVLALLEASTTT